MFFLNLTGEGLYNGVNFKKEGIPWLGIVDGKYTIEFKLNLYSLVRCGGFLFVAQGMGGRGNGIKSTSDNIGHYVREQEA